jgi:hypothetical protein
MCILEVRGEGAANALAATTHPGLDVGVGEHGAGAQLDPGAETALTEQTAVARDLEASCSWDEA